MRSHWFYRLVFFGAVALSVALVLVTLTGRERGQARAESALSRSALPVRVTRREQPAEGESLSRQAGARVLTSRVRITTIVPFQREIHIHNFGDAAEDLGRWQLVSPRPGGEDRYDIPIGVVLLPAESLVVAVEEGIDVPGQLHWRVSGETRVLEPAADTVILFDDQGREVSRFAYTRR